MTFILLGLGLIVAVGLAQNALAARAATNGAGAPAPPGAAPPGKAAPPFGGGPGRILGLPAKPPPAPVPKPAQPSSPGDTILPLPVLLAFDPRKRSPKPVPVDPTFQVVVDSLGEGAPGPMQLTELDRDEILAGGFRFVGFNSQESE